MLNLDTLSKLFEKERNAISKRSKTAVSRLEKKREVETERINAQYESQIAEQRKIFEDQKEQAYQGYIRRAAGELTCELQHDYDILQERSSLLRISEDDLEKARKVQQTLGRLGDEKAKDMLKEILQIVGTEEGIQIALSQLAREPTPHTIISYIAGGKDNKVYLLSPIYDSTKQELAKDLENKILDILKPGDIYVGRIIQQDTQRNGSNPRAAKIEFSHEYDIVNGFLLYRLKVPKQDSSVPELVVKGLVEKMNELQPASFEKVKLTHRVQLIEPALMDYFKAHSVEDMYSTRDVLQKLLEHKKGISYEEASKIVGRSIRVLKALVTKDTLDKNEQNDIDINSLIVYMEKHSTKRLNPKHSDGTKGPKSNYHLDFNSTNHDQIRSEAYQRLQQLGDKLRMKDLQHVLGLRTLSGATNAANHYLDVQKEGRIIYVPAENVRRFITEKTPTGAGWKQY